MTAQPRPWWFFCSIPAAMIIAYVGWIARFLVSGGWNDVLEMGAKTAVIGAATFPIGAPFVIWITPTFVVRHLWVLSMAGYVMYLVLCVLGTRSRSLKLFVFLCVLLLLNVAGCHTNHTTASLPLSP